MSKKRITETERIGSCNSKFPIILDEAIDSLQKMKSKYGGKAIIKYDTEWDYADYPEGYIQLQYSREETDLEYEKRLKKIETAKKSKIKGDATKKENKLKHDRLSFECMKKEYPEWFKEVK